MREPAFPYTAWVNHYDRGVQEVEVLGFDWYDQTESDDTCDKVYYRFSDGLIDDAEIARVFGDERAVLMAAIQDADRSAASYEQDARKALLKKANYQKRLNEIPV